MIEDLQFIFFLLCISVWGNCLHPLIQITSDEAAHFLLFFVPLFVLFIFEVLLALEKNADN